VHCEGHVSGRVDIRRCISWGAYGIETGRRLKGCTDVQRGMSGGCDGCCVGSGHTGVRIAMRMVPVLARTDRRLSTSRFGPRRCVRSGVR